jgi:hypothetical protein
MRFIRTTSFLSRLPARRLYLHDDTRKAGVSERFSRWFKTGFGWVQHEAHIGEIRLCAEVFSRHGTWESRRHGAVPVLWSRGSQLQGARLFGWSVAGVLRSP